MKTFYQIISLVFQPLLMPTYAFLMLMNMDMYANLPLLWRLVAIIGTFTFTGVLPAVTIFLMMRKGEVNDLFISKREERTMPYLFSFMAYVFWVLFLYRTLQFLPNYVVAMGIGSVVSIIVIVIVNLKWKISAHLSGIGGLTGAIFGICFRTALNPVWLFTLILFISALVALSRIELKAHTPSQTLAGFVVGFLMIFLPCVFY